MFDARQSVRIVDCIAERLTWPQYEQLLLETRPRYYITHATAPTLANDMRGVTSAKALGATRKWDQHGEWHYITQGLRLAWVMLRSPTAHNEFARRHWYDDARRDPPDSSRARGGD